MMIAPTNGILKMKGRNNNMSLADKINVTDSEETVTSNAVTTVDAVQQASGGGPKSNMFECICILGSPFWTQPLRVPGNKHKKTLEALDPTNVNNGGKKSLSTYKASIPFAALFVAHEDIIVPRLPVERTAKTGYMPNEMEHITVKKGQEVVMTYLEIAILGMTEDFQNKFKFRGVDYGLTIVPKLKSFNSKSQVGPNGIRVPTPSLVATDGSGMSAKKTMEMICQKDPYMPNRPVWGNTPRDLLYKERYEHMWAGHPVHNRHKITTTRVTDGTRISPSTQMATTCRAILEKAYASRNLTLNFNTQPTENADENAEQNTNPCIVNE